MCVFSSSAVMASKVTRQATKLSFACFDSIGIKLSVFE
jgi:hypothetical protein